MSDFEDEFSGQGGSYVADPNTGKRQLIGRTQDQRGNNEQPVKAADQPAASEGE